MPAGRGKKLRANTPATAARAAVRPRRRSEACSTYLSDISARASGMMHSPTHTGTPAMSIWPSCRSAMTTPKLP